jgi:hypothetical protein
MPNRDEHIKKGGWTTAITLGFMNILSQAERKRQDSSYQFNFLELAGVGAVGYGTGAIAAQLPDILEPSIHPGHRNFFHSVGFGTLAILGTKKLNDNPAIPEGLKLVMNSAAVGYVSHLVLDGNTPAGLPIV